MTEVLRQIPIEFLQRSRFQPRTDFNAQALQELADSIREQGIVEPIIVRPLDKTRFEIIAGERRWRAAQLAGLSEVPCIARHYSDHDAAEVTLIENIQREGLNPIEEARALQCLLDEFHYTHDEIAKSIGKSRTKITNALRLLQLDTEVQQWLIEKKLTEGHGKALAGLPMSMQRKVALHGMEEGWSVRQMEQAVKNAKQTPTSAKSATTDPNIGHLERAAAEHFGSEVKLENHNSDKSGWIKIKYYDYETLSGILE